MSFVNNLNNSKRHYDKFGFLVAEPEPRREYDKPKSSRYNRRSPDPGRNRSSPKYSPRSDEYRMDRSDREPRRRKRDFSPDPREFTTDVSSKRDDFDNWESSFNQPPHGFVSTPQAPPAPTFSNEPMPYSMTGNYDAFNAPSYSGFSVPPSGAAPPHLDLGHDLNIPIPPPPPSMQQGSWSQITPPVNPPQDDKVKREAIASEMRNQRATLSKQREEYLKKAQVLQHELDSLKKQRIELRGNSRRTPSPDSQRFLKENAKLQIEIKNKLGTMNNVIDMLNGIIGENPPTAGDMEKSKSRKAKSPGKSPTSSGDSSPGSEKRSSSRNKRKSRSRSKLSEKKFNYVYYDPEMHWCRICNEFPATAKDYLNHLHSPEHHRNSATQLETPWHNQTTPQNEGMPNYPGAPSKRTPIKGLQFFVPSSAWYCKLCDQWIGDLHCASAHLKSLLHSQNYSNFIELNPHWEMDFMSDRQKNFQKMKKNVASVPEPTKAQYAPHTISFQADGFHTKKKKGASPTSEKKLEITDKNKKRKERKRKKKHSSSDSSGSSSSSSDSDDKKRKKYTKDKDENQKESISKSDSDVTRMLSQWMSLKKDALTEHDKKILEKLKNKVKIKAGEKVEQKVDSRVVSREREARELLNIQSDRARETLNNIQRKEKERDEKQRSKDMSSRKDERDLGDFKPYPGRRENQDHNEARFDKQISEKQKKQSGSGSSNSASSDSKKMPFIGKMPLFKSLTNKPTKSESEPTKALDRQKCVEAAKKKIDEINAHIMQASVETLKKKLSDADPKDSSTNLPAPGLALPTALGGMLPPPIVSNVPKSNAGTIAYPQTIHRIQKSPVHITETSNSSKNEIKKSPSPQKNAKNDAALHKDFQDALDIIFPSEEQKKKEENAASVMSEDVFESNINILANIPPPSMNNPYPSHMPMMPNMPHQGYMGPMGPNSMGPMGPNNMGPMGPNNGPMGPMPPNNMGPMGPNMGPMGHNMGPMGPMGPNNMGPMGPNNMGPMGPNNMGPMGPNMGPMGMMGGPMPPSGPMGMMGYQGGMFQQQQEVPQSNPKKSKPSKKASPVNDDLAMLGIDEGDVGASGF